MFFRRIDSISKPLSVEHQNQVLNTPQASHSYINEPSWDEGAVSLSSVIAI
jgi:hypothetical protein